MFPNNVYKKPAVFRSLPLRVQDYWIGLLFWIQENAQNLKDNRKRKFIAIRAVDQSFLNSGNTELTELDVMFIGTKPPCSPNLLFFVKTFTRHNIYWASDELKMFLTATAFLLQPVSKRIRNYQALCWK